MFRLPQNGRLPLCNVGDIAMGMNDASQNVALASTRGRMISGCKGACMPIWWIFNNIVALHTGFFSWWISIRACRCYPSWKQPPFSCVSLAKTRVGGPGEAPNFPVFLSKHPRISLILSLKLRIPARGLSARTAACCCPRSTTRIQSGSGSSHGAWWCTRWRCFATYR